MGNSNGLRHLRVFDLDRTLIKNNCSFAFCRYLVSQGVLSRSSLFFSAIYYLRHLYFGMSLIDLHKLVFDRYLKGRSLSSLEVHVEPFLQQNFLPSLNLPALSQLKLAQHLGHHTLILSNSPDFLVCKIAKILKVSDWKATEYAVDKQQRLCHILSIMQGEEKVSCMLNMAKQLQVGKSEITAYSDSVWGPSLSCALQEPL